MILKLIPETEEEKAMLSEQEYADVQEFFLFGSKKDENGDIIDFHNWRGNHRYLIGSIEFYLRILDDERRARTMPSTDRITRQFKKTVPADSSNLQMVEIGGEEEAPAPVPFPRFNHFKKE